MARPIKTGMDYFPHDCDAANDEKIEAMRAIYGNDGYAFYFILLERIYRAAEAELNVSNPALKAALIKKIGIDNERFEEMFKTALELGLFDKEAYKENIITSNGARKRYQEVDRLRERWRNKKKSTKQQNEAKDNVGVFSRENIEDNIGENEGKGTQRKEKKRKEKKSIYNNNQLEFLNSLYTISNYSVDEDKDIEMFNRLTKLYPQLNLLEAVQSWAIYKLDKPLNENSNPRSQFNTWCKKSLEMGKCLKQSEPVSGDKIIRRDDY